MPQAVYQPTNIGHFGLALGEYGHFTSPIRRYPDLVVHRTLKALVGAQDGSGVRYEAEALACRARSSRAWRSGRMRRIATCQPSSNACGCAERIGQTFRGLITTVVEFGCFVQLMDVAIDGLLHLDNLRDDEYLMDDHGMPGAAAQAAAACASVPSARHRDRGESHRGADRSGSGARES